jgi:hypothetical protein
MATRYMQVNCDFSITVLILVKVTLEPGANYMWQGYI